MDDEVVLCWLMRNYLKLVAASFESPGGAWNIILPVTSEVGMAQQTRNTRVKFGGKAVLLVATGSNCGQFDGETMIACAGG
jgi:hypothetical protein